MLLAATSLALPSCLEFHAGPIPGTPKSATFEQVKGARVHYIDEGEGPTVVLIHGFASSLGTWTGVRKALAPNHRVIALDLKGFGLTSRPEGDYSPKAQAELVLGLLDARDVEGPVILVAHSWGSSVALQVALLAPERVRKVALYDAWVYEDQLPTSFHWARADGMGELIIGAFYDERPDDKMAMAFYDKKYVTEELVETVEQQLDRPGTKAAALAAIRGQRYDEVEASYSKIKQPVLLLWGREDRVTTLKYGERLMKDLPDARLEVYPQCGHFPMIEAVRPSTRDLLAFIDAPLPAAATPAPAPKREDEPPAKPADKPSPEADGAEPAPDSQR